MPSNSPELPVHRPQDHDGPIRVLLADDHRITLWGLQQLIESARPRMALAGAVTTCQDLLAHPALPDADVIVLDLDLDGTNGADALGELALRSAARVLVLTAEDDLAVHREVMVKGARGVVHKSAPSELLLRAIEKVAGGEVWLDGKLLGEVLSTLTGHAAAAPSTAAQAAAVASLTPREHEVVVAMARLPNAKQLAVADELGMSEHTLRNHLTTIYDKLGVRGRMGLYLYATSHGLVPTPAEPAQG